MTLTVPCLFGLESLVAGEMRRLNLGGVRAENGMRQIVTEMKWFSPSGYAMIKASGFLSGCKPQVARNLPAAN